jgi:hypothetical protein
MLWPKWVVLIAGSTGSALRAVRPPNCHITPDARGRGVGIFGARQRDCRTKSCKQFLDADRQVSDTFSGRMVHGVRNCCGGPRGRNFADTFDAYGIEA